MGSLGGGGAKMKGVIAEVGEMPRGIDEGLAGCHVCHKVSPVVQERCPRCGVRLHLRKKDSVSRTLALVVASAVMYIPANLLPIMSFREFGVETKSTIISGLIQFWNMGSYPIAIVIFTASILIPFLKIASLLWLCGAVKGMIPNSGKFLGKVYWVTELLGRWSMVDIFVVAILVTMVQLGNYMRVTPGPGALAFAGVVILTMFAAMSFDPKLLWDQLQAETEQSAEKSIKKP